MSYAPHPRPVPLTTPRPTPAGGALTALTAQIFRLHSLLLAAGYMLTEQADQTTARRQVLGAVEHAPASVAQIARALGRARQSVQYVADILVDDGLAAYSDNPAHRRARLLGLTRPGRVALGIMQHEEREWANELGAEIGVRQLTEAGAVLERMRRVLTAHLRAARHRRGRSGQEPPPPAPMEDVDDWVGGG